MFDDVDKEFERIRKKNQENLENAKITPIRQDFQFAKNGLWVMIGTMGGGKTYTYLRIARKQERLFDEPFYETVTICSTSGEFDETVRSFKVTIKKSNLLTVKDDDLLEFLNKYNVKSKVHKSLNCFVKSKFREPDEVMNKLIQKFNLNTKDKLIDFIAETLTEIGWKTYPHRMLLILDDFASHPLLKHKEFPLPALLKKLRHFNITVIICVQTTMSITLDIKRIASDYIIFPGVSNEDFRKLFIHSTLSCF